MDSLNMNHSITHNHADNSKLKINENTQIVIENDSNDITISKCDEISIGKEAPLNNLNHNSVLLKSQVLPVVYIQNNNNNNTNSNNGNKTNNNNSNNKNNDVRNANKLLLSKLNKSTDKINNSVSLSSTANTNCVNKLKTHVPTVPIPVPSKKTTRPLLLPKTPITLNAKVASTYLSMVKKMSPAESQLTSQSEHGLVSNAQKFVIAPVSKLPGNRQQSTIANNSLQSKFTVLPMPVPQSDNDVPPSQKVYNFQIADGKLQYSNFSSPLTIMCETKHKFKHQDDDELKKNLMCDEKIDLSIDEDGDVKNKSYELSIPDQNNTEENSKQSISLSDSNSLEANSNYNNNKQSLKFPQGVSILKKNFLSNLLQESKKNESCNNRIDNKSNIDKDVTITKLSNKIDDKTTCGIKSKIDLKSDKDKDRNLTELNNCQQDCTEMVIDLEEFTNQHYPNNNIKKEIKTEDETSTKSDDMEIEFEVVAENGNSKNLFNSDCKDTMASKLLNWEDGVGSLPGSTLIFTINEFNIIEYLSDSDYQNVLNGKMKKAKEKEDMEREIRCVECGCYGMRADFVSFQYCSTECQETNAKKQPVAPVTVQVENPVVPTKKNVKRKFIKSKSDNDIKDINNDVSGAEEDNSNDTIPTDKSSYPWACTKKGFSWSKYLMHVNAKAAPTKLFKDPFPYNRNGFRPGMKLEGVDPQHPSYFCILTVVDIAGYRIRLHFDGYSENYDFWVNADSPDIFPVGWCEKYGHSLHLPPGYKEETFSWMMYLKATKSNGAPKHLFPSRAGQAICPNGFRIGMKLEAVDKNDASLICVATVKDMMDNRLLIHFDGWDDIYDYWADPTSPYIHPVGWCDQVNHRLTPPSDYPNPENFIWETYLKKTKAVPAPSRAFKQRSTCGFKKGMRLECVDKRVPHLIRVATIDDVRGHQIRIHFDGWPEKYSYWLDDDNSDIHPVGWCQKTGHPIEPPLTPDDVYDFLECPTVGCRGQGHILGLKYLTHSNPKYCPYAEDNINIDKVLPDRLLSPDNNPQVKVPVSREPKEKEKEKFYSKPRVGRPPKWLKQLAMNQVTKEPDEEPPEKKLKPQLPKFSPKHKPVLKLTDQEKKELKKAQKIIKDSKILPAEKETWVKHSNFLNKHVSPHENPFEWTVYDVAEFVTSVPGCETSGSIFKEQDFDGEAFLLLKQSDILDLLRMKIGPAIKLYNSIVLLRQRCWK